MDPRLEQPETGCPASSNEHEAGSTSRGNAYDRLFDTGIAHLHRYAALHGTSSPPRGATIDGFAIGQWVVNRRAEYRRGHLSAERIRRLDTEFPDWVWNVRDAMFDVGVTHLHRFAAVHGTSNAGEGDVIDGFEIGTWVASRRADYRRGRLSADRIARLDSEFPDWQWLPQDEAFAAAFETGLSHLRRYVAAHGTSQVPQRDVIDGFPIGTWVATVAPTTAKAGCPRSGSAASKPSSRTGGGRYDPPPRKAGGDTVPSEHDSPTAGRRRADDRRFDIGIAHLHRYVAAHGSSSPPRHATIDGFRIGAWVDSRRTDYRLGRLSPERIRRIETDFPDWRWNVLDAAFAIGIAHLRRYAATHGTSNPRQHDVIDDFPIGQWAANRRADYRTGRLPADRISLFDNEFQDWQWNPQDAASAAAFEAGLAHLHRYRVVHGTSNPRQREVIDGFAIGQWVANRRADYRRGRLSADRVRRLETEFPNWRWTVRGRS